MINNAQLKSVEEIRAYLQDAFRDSKKTPPDTRYQLGFYAALEEMERLTDPDGYSWDGS